MAKCGLPCERYSRVVGYFRPVANWNKGKKQEFEDRLEFQLPTNKTGEKKMESNPKFWEQEASRLKQANVKLSEKLEESEKDKETIIEELKLSFDYRSVMILNKKIINAHIEALQYKNMANCAKRTLFEMWHAVESGQFDSRSPYGDTALKFRDALFDDENVFNSEYAAFKERYRNANAEGE